MKMRSWDEWLEAHDIELDIEHEQDSVSNQLWL